MQVSVIHYSGSYNSKYLWHFLIKPVIPYLVFTFHRQFIEPLVNLTPFYITLHEAIRSDDSKLNTLESTAKILLARHCFEL